MHTTNNCTLASSQRSLDVFQSSYLYQSRQCPTIASQAHHIYRLTRTATKKVLCNVSPFCMAQLIAENTFEFCMISSHVLVSCR